MQNMQRPQTAVLNGFRALHRLKTPRSCIHITTRKSLRHRPTRGILLPQLDEILTLPSTKASLNGARMALLGRAIAFELNRLKHLE